MQTIVFKGFASYSLMLILGETAFGKKRFAAPSLDRTYYAAFWQESRTGMRFGKDLAKPHSTRMGRYLRYDTFFLVRLASLA
jgi:hypothetical protein